MSQSSRDDKNCERCAELERQLAEQTNEAKRWRQACQDSDEARAAPPTAFDAGVEAAAKEVESHWNHIDTDVNQHEQSMRSASAIRRLKRNRPREFVSPDQAEALRGLGFDPEKRGMVITKPLTVFQSSTALAPQHLQDAARVKRETFRVISPDNPMKMIDVVYAPTAACIEREANQLRAQLTAANLRADARAREACTAEKRATCSFASSASGAREAVLTEVIQRLEKVEAMELRCGERRALCAYMIRAVRGLSRDDIGGS